MSALRQKPPLKEGPSVLMGSAAVPLTSTRIPRSQGFWKSPADAAKSRQSEWPDPTVRALLRLQLPLD